MHVDEEFSGAVVEKLSKRRAELVEMIPSQVGNKVRLIFHAPSRGLIGYHSEFLTDTRGTGVMNRIFYAFEPYKGEIEDRRNGVMISSENGQAIAYSLWKLQDRGPMFVEHNSPVYVGMIIGEHTKYNDIEVNPTKSKQLTNIRAAGKDEAIDLIPPRKMSLEQALAKLPQKCEDCLNPEQRMASYQSLGLTLNNRIEMWQKAVVKHNEIELGKHREEEALRQKFAAFLADKYGDRPPLDGNTYLNNLVINLFMVLDNTERHMMMSVLKSKGGLSLLQAIDKAPKDDSLLRNIRRELDSHYQEYQKSLQNSMVGRENVRS